MTLASLACSEHLGAAAMVSASAVRMSLMTDLSIRAGAAVSVVFRRLAGHALANIGETETRCSSLQRLRTLN